MPPRDLQNKTALVTGASSGLGVDFPHILAERGADLVLVARRRERLEELAKALRAQHGVTVDVVPMDLAEPDAGQALYDELQARGRDVHVLVNNAGYGTYGDFVDIPWERERNMLQLDILTVVHLTKLFVRDMVARDEGWVLQIASIGAYQPSPTYATYAAAKSFVLHFGEALSYELRNTGVKVSVLSPGVTKTEFLDVAGQKQTCYQRLAMMESRPVAEEGVKMMLRGRPSRVSGLLNRVSIWLLRFTPRRMMAALAHWLMREPEAG